MGRVGDHHVGLGHFTHHPSLGHFPLQLAHPRFDLGLALGVLVLVAHFLLGHARLLLVVPDLERHIHRRNHDQRTSQQQQRGAQHPATVKDRARQRLVTQGQEIIGTHAQHQQRHGQHHQELGYRLEQLDQRLDREHALEPRRGIESLTLGRQQLGAEQPATEQHRANQRSDQQHQKQRADDTQPLANGGQQMQAHGIGAVQHLTLKGEVVDHQVHQLAGHARAKHQQPHGGHHHHRQGIQLAGARHLPFLAGFLLAFRRGVFCAFLTAVFRHQRAPTISRSQISASEANR